MSYLFDELKPKDEDVKVEDKVLLMGLQEAGKTAIKDVVFFDKLPDEVEDYMATIHYDRQFIDAEQTSLVIDTGGQESYWNEAVTHFRHLVFSNVKLLLWIVDLTRPDLFEESERRFSFTIRQFKKENPDGIIAVLCHKIDLVAPEKVAVLLEYIMDSFDEPKFDIQFEPTSIYYPDSLKELIFALMKEAKMNAHRFELITNLGEKIEESGEFQSYMIENRDDPRVQQLRDYLNPKPEPIFPTFGKLSTQFDLTAYDIIEIVLIDRETFSPIIGVSSQDVVSIEKSMEYIIALQEFKKLISEKKNELNSRALILTSANQKVYGMLFDLQTNFLLITSFSPITEEKTRILYGLIREFSQTIDTSKKVEKVVERPRPEPEKPPIQPISTIPPSISDQTQIQSIKTGTENSEEEIYCSESNLEDLAKFLIERKSSIQKDVSEEENKE